VSLLDGAAKLRGTFPGSAQVSDIAIPIGK
jgi:hypothetical protein